MANEQGRPVEGARLSGQGSQTGKLVEFDQDVFPHVAGEIKRLDSKELKRVNERANINGLKGSVYHERKFTKEEEDAVKRDRTAAQDAGLSEPAN